MIQQLQRLPSHLHVLVAKFIFQLGIVDTGRGGTGNTVYRNAARVGRDPMTVSRIWNQWFQDGSTERRAGSQRPLITSRRKDRHVTLMALTGRAAFSRALSQELGSIAKQQMSA
ncbi:HTH_Tnp_Tc3_2 domain-containing protein [Trichonephila clavipes]|nr:HTH_Tnp_Tc3_2 domain-containing protein [Trichonephila clavipes]